MRQSVFSMMAVVAISLCLAACQHEQMPETPQESVRKISVRATQADTRTAVIVDGQGYHPTWTEGDWISLYEFSDAGVASGESNGLGANVEDFQHVTTFDVDFEGDPQGSSFYYVGAYSTCVGKVYSGIDEDYDDLWAQAWGETPETPRWGLVGWIPERQEPLLDSFDPKADVMFSQKTPESQQRPDEISLAFARVGSIAKITLKGLPKNDRVLWGRLTYGPSWNACNIFVYDPTIGQIAVAPPDEEIDPVIEFFFKSDDYPDLPELTVGDDQQAVIWLRTLSGTLTDHFSITVYTEDQYGNERVFVKDVDLESSGKSIEFKENGITAFNVGMETHYTNWYMDYMDSDRGESTFTAFVRYKKSSSIEEYGLLPWNGTPLSLKSVSFWRDWGNEIEYKFVFDIEEGTVENYYFMGYIKTNDGTVYYNKEGAWEVPAR